MGDFLTELFDQFDPEDQVMIRATKGAIKVILAQGAAAVRNRQLATGSAVVTDWVLEPKQDARADAAGIVFAAYVDALWRRTDPARSESIQEFGAKVDKLVATVLARCGREGECNITELRWRCWMNIQTLRQRARSEALGAAEGGNTGSAQPGDDLVISVKPDSILQFLGPWRIRQRRKQDLQASYRRHNGRNQFEADSVEKLLSSARGWAEPLLRELVSEAKDVFQLKQRVAKQAFDKFIKEDSYFWERFPEFASALWEEERPSLEDHAILALAAKAAATGPVPSAVVTKKPAADTQAPESQTNVARKGVDEDGERAPAAPQSVKANDSPAPTEKGTPDEATQAELATPPAPTANGERGSDAVGTNRRGTRGPKPDDEGHRRTAELLSDIQWRDDLERACRILDEPPDGGSPVSVSMAWQKDGVKSWVHAVEEMRGEREIIMAIERRIKIGILLRTTTR
ncbi:MAG: hypothetical protein ABSG32_32595 [Terriglobia bacterium]